MPIQMIPGVEFAPGQSGQPQQQDRLERFASMMLQAKESKRKEAIDKLGLFMDVAERTEGGVMPDIKEVERLTKEIGLEGLDLAGIGKVAKERRETQQKAAQAQIESFVASTGAAQAQTKQSEAVTESQRLSNTRTTRIQEMRDQLSAATDPAERSRLISNLGFWGEDVSKLQDADYYASLGPEERLAIKTFRYRTDSGKIAEEDRDRKHEADLLKSAMDMGMPPFMAMRVAQAGTLDPDELKKKHGFTDEDFADLKTLGEREFESNKKYREELIRIQGEQLGVEQYRADIEALKAYKEVVLEMSTGQNKKLADLMNKYMDALKTGKDAKVSKQILEKIEAELAGLQGLKPNPMFSRWTSLFVSKYLENVDMEAAKANGDKAASGPQDMDSAFQGYLTGGNLGRVTGETARGLGGVVGATFDRTSRGLDIVNAAKGVGNFASEFMQGVAGGPSTPQVPPPPTKEEFEKHKRSQQFINELIEADKKRKK